MADSDISAAERCGQLTFQARAYHRQGDVNRTVETCLEALRCGDVPMQEGAFIESLLRESDQIELADQIRAQLLRGLSQVEEKHGESHVALLHIANVLILMGEHNTALPHLKRAFEMAPTDTEVVFLSLLCTLESGTFVPGAVDVAPLLKSHPDPKAAMSSLVALLGHHGEKDEALRLLDLTEQRVGTFAPDSRIALQRAALMGSTENVEQREVTNKIFDSFADSYDQSLAVLGNNGPQMIGQMMDDLGLPKENQMKVFDAGCGTGLCEPYLRPRASLLHGADLSIKMLEKCLAKGTFDLLCRSDLAAIETLPDDTFDLVVCADVLVYFGNLEQVFANLVTRLVPQGWFIFTVEAAPDDLPAPGYGLNPSGRNQHSLPYLKATLDATGYDFVTFKSDTLRLEFRQPVSGYVVAARKR